MGGQAIYTFGARYVTASRDMFAFANVGKYHIASNGARYIATAKAVISRFAFMQNISLGGICRTNSLLAEI